MVDIRAAQLLGAVLALWLPAMLGRAQLTEEWAAIYDGSAGAQDQARAVTVDPSGFVYVTGHAAGEGTSDDIVTIKYGDGGGEKWVALFNGSGNGNDAGADIVLDDDGKVLVTGTTRGSSGWSNIVTIKYDRDGNEEWVAEFDGLLSMGDSAEAIAVDQRGNVYVTGRSYVGWEDGEYDWVTIKYDNQGNEVWVRYLGEEGVDSALAIGVDDSSNVYVAGYTSFCMMVDCQMGFTVAKYGPSGTLLWEDTLFGYNQWYFYENAIAYDMTVRPDGTVYATGYIGDWALNSEGYDSWLTIKYSSSGERLWTREYNYSTYHSDRAYAVAVDDSGSAYVAGRIYHQFATIKYDLEGNQRWLTRHRDGNGLGIVVSSDGSTVCTTGESEDVCTTVLHDRGGAERWVGTYQQEGTQQSGATQGSGAPQCIAIDPHGNIYVTGYGSAPEASDDYVTLMYSSKSVGVASSLRATPTGPETILLEWEVRIPDGTRELSVCRATSPGGPFVAVNNAVLIPASPGEYEDSTAWPGGTFWYVLKAVRADGTESELAAAKAAVTTGGPPVASLVSASPNPFRFETAVEFIVPSSGDLVTLSVYNLKGQLVRTLLEDSPVAGRRNVCWDGTNNRGDLVSAGVYFATLRAGARHSVLKTVLVRHT
ncbi:MAG: SBBP repeat-containing protein [Candidatus Eisenbacteria bacterium]